MSKTIKFITKFLVVWAIRMTVIATLMSIFFVFGDNNNIANTIRIVLAGVLFLASGVGAYFTLLYSNKPVTYEERAKGLFWAALTPAFLAAAQYISQNVTTQVKMMNGGSQYHSAIIRKTQE